MRHISKLPRCLAESTAISAGIRCADGNITARAAGRLNVIQARIDELQPKAAFDSAAAEEYQQLLEERSQLDIILMDTRAD